MSDDPGTRRVIIGRDVPEGDVPRADVAAVIAAVLENDGTIGRQWELIHDGLLIVEAIAVALLAELGGDPLWASKG